MPYGLYLNNQNGKRVVGSDTVAPRFIGKYTQSSFSVTSNYGDFLKFSVTCNGKPLPFLYVPYGYIASVNRIVQKTSTQYDIYVFVGFYRTGLTLSDITLYLFSDGNYTKSSTGYGIQVMKSNGEVAYDSGHSHLRIKTYFALNEASSGSGANTWVWNDSKTWSDLGMSKPAIMSYQNGAGMGGYIPYVSGFYVKWWHYYQRQSIGLTTNGLSWGWAWARDPNGTTSTEHDARAAMIIGNFSPITHNTFSSCWFCPTCSVYDMYYNFYGIVNHVNWKIGRSGTQIYAINGADYD